MVSAALGPEWNSALRALAAIPVTGRITLSYRREPDYFEGARVQGSRVSVLGTIEETELVSTVTRSIKRAFVDGRETELGYWGGLRVRERCRGKMLLGQGYAYLKELHEADPAEAYLCTFVKGNQKAIEALTMPRRTLPANIPWGEYHTYSIFLRGGANAPRARVPISALPGGLELRTGTAVDTGEACSFLRSVLRKRQFAPAYYPQDFATGYLSRLDPSGWIGAYRGGRLEGIAARWSQKEYKQTVVVSYAAALEASRRFVNGVLSAAGYHGFPERGEALSSSYLAFLGVRDDEPRTCSALMDGAVRMAAEAGDHFLVAGFHERDPLERVVRRRPHVRYDSFVFLAAWSDREAAVRAWSRALIPYLEVGTL